jgi:hypothetical protein
MHPGVLVAGVGAIDVLLASQAAYALRRRERARSHRIERNGPPKRPH